MKRTLLIIFIALMPFLSFALSIVFNYDNKDLSWQKFDNADLDKSSWKNAILIGVNFNFTRLYQADFTDAIITKAEVGGNRYRGGFNKIQIYSTKSYKDKNLEGVNFSVNNLKGWDFSGQNLENARFEFCDLYGAFFCGANLKNVSFYDQNSGSSTFHKVDFSDSIITNCVFKDATNRGLKKEQIYSTKNYKCGSLEGIDFSYCILTSWSFFGQDLKNINFKNAKLIGVDFSFANLDGVNFENADLRGASFDFANIKNVNFEGVIAKESFFQNLRKEDDSVK